MVVKEMTVKTVKMENVDLMEIHLSGIGYITGIRSRIVFSIRCNNNFTSVYQNITRIWINNTDALNNNLLSWIENIGAGDILTIRNVEEVDRVAYFTVMAPGVETPGIPTARYINVDYIDGDDNNFPSTPTANNQFFVGYVKSEDGTPGQTVKWSNGLGLRGTMSVSFSMKLTGAFTNWAQPPPFVGDAVNYRKLDGQLTKSAFK